TIRNLNSFFVHFALTHFALMQGGLGKCRKANGVRVERGLKRCRKANPEILMHSFTGNWPGRPERQGQSFLFQPLDFRRTEKFRICKPGIPQRQYCGFKDTTPVRIKFKAGHILQPE
ncbi:MAG: hypothetical protein VXW11_07015, partial [Pseudomonadota bacterium]|nr:hypothetical protein [Pseudomonadota bacterium]